jgi:hypothetical protein
VKYIPYVDDWVKEHYQSLKYQKQKKLAKKLNQIAKWNKSSLKSKTKRKS